MKMSKTEAQFARDVLETAADYIANGWGEPLKDVDFRDIDNERANKLIEHCAQLIRSHLGAVG